MPNPRQVLAIDRYPRLRSLGLGLAAAALYYASIEASDAWTPHARHVPVLWLPTGVGYALVVVGGRRYVWPIALAALLEAAVEGRGLWQSPVVAVGAALSALAIVELVRRARAFGERPVDTVVRFAAGATGAAIGATALLVAVPTLVPAHLWANAFVARVAGAAVAGPALRTWLRRDGGGVASRAEAVAIVVVSAGLAELVGSGAIQAGTPALYVMFPPIILAALRAGRRGTSTALLATAAILASDLTAGRGPFTATTLDAGASLGVFLSVLSVCGLLLAGLETARRGGETTLRQSEERFRALIENATDLVSVISPDGAILFESPSASRILGWQADELVGRNLTELAHPDDRQRLVEGARRVAAAGETTTLLRFRHKDGGWVELESRARDLTASPTVGGILVNSRDVTRARRAERELAEAERRYREFVESLPLVAYVNDLAGADSAAHLAPRYVSPQVEELLGYPASAWLEDPGLAGRIIHPDDRHLPNPRALGADGETFSAEYRMIAADGSVVWVLDRRRVLRDADGEPVAVQGFLVDITRRKRLEEQLGRAERMEALGQLAGGVAHDFNNLLTAIMGYAELAQGHAGDPETVATDLEQVRHAAQRASALTRQLLAFGRRQALEHVVLDLNDVVAETEQLLARLIDENVEIVSDLDPGLGSVRADPGQLAQVLVNLAVNARDAMPRGGRLTIATETEIVGDGGEVPPGEYAVVSVADTGHGIPDAVRERLFEPFFTTKEVGKGTGLGLSVVYGIVEQCNGHLVVRSEAGRGAEFRVMLPCSDERREVAAEAADVAPRDGETVRGGETVLLVEDEELVRRLTSAMLERLGYRVLEARSPEEALAVADPYDLVLTDVVMPGMSGPELVERLRNGREPAVLFASGYSAAAVADRGSLRGALLEKPFTLEELARGVRRALDGRARR